jgi:hypothetical protein
MRMRRQILLVMFVVSAAGCATGQVAYEKPGSTETERKRDVGECAQQSIGHALERQHVLMPVPIDREAFAKCLEGRGYRTVRK